MRLNVSKSIESKNFRAIFKPVKVINWLKDYARSMKPMLIKETETCIVEIEQLL